MAKKEKYKVLTIVGLAVVLLILTFVFIFTDTAEDEQEFNPDIKVIMTPEKFRKDIDSIIYSFGILEEWKVKENKKNGDLILNETIQIPKDLQTIDLNLEISDYLDHYGFTSLTNEDPKLRNVSMEIFQIKDSIKTKYAELNFIYSDNVIRNVSEICVVLDSIEYIEFSNAESIIKSPEKFSVLLPLGNDKADYQSMIIDNKKNYLLKFNIGSNDDITSDFRSDMKESIIKQRIRTIAINFPGASGAVIFFPKEKKSFAEMIKEEFRKNNITVFSDTLFKEIITKENKVNRLFDEIKSNNKKGIRIQYYTVSFSEKDFDEYEKKIWEIKKPGYKFISITEAVKKNKEKETVAESDTLKTK